MSDPQAADSKSASVESSSESSAPSSGFRPWHGAGLLLVGAVVGLGLYGLWPVITGQAGDEAAAEDVEAPASEAAVDVVVAKRVNFPLRTQANGHLVPWQRATLKVEASGPIVERAVQEGDRVAEGALIARLQNREERIALKEARAKLLKARAEYQARYAVGADTTEGESPAPTASGTSNASPSGEGGAGASSTREATQAAVSGLTDARQAVERARLPAAWPTCRSTKGSTWARARRSARSFGTAA